MASNTPQGRQTVRLPFVMNNTQGLDITKGQVVVNGFFEALSNHATGEKDLFLLKRPGLSTLMSPATQGPGRGCHVWSRTGKLYSVNNNKIYSNTTDLGVTMITSSGLVSFAETRPGATTPYLGINDGQVLYLIGSDDTVLILNNVVITSSSVANPTTITTTTPHNLQTGNKVIIRNHTGSTPNINDTTIFTITRTGTNTFTIPVNVTVGGVNGTLGVFPSPNTGDLQYMDTFWFVMKLDASIWNCASDDPPTWPILGTINTQMLPGIGVGLGRQNNVLIGFTDRHAQMFYDAANPAGISPLANIEQAMQQVGCVASSSIASNENTTYWVSNTATGGMSVYRLDGTSNLRDIATPQVRRSITKNAFSIVGPNSQVRIILTAGTTWTVPADFNASNNTIEAIGAGGGAAQGVNSSIAPNSGGGGGGGAYAKIVNFNPSGAPTISYSIGVGGTGGIVAGANPTDGTSTTFNTSSLIADGGKKASNVIGGNGGSTASSTGTTKKNGGGGGTGSFTFLGGAGGGGAGGLGADGATGNNSSGSDGASGGQGDPLLGGLGGTDVVHDHRDGQPGSEYTTAGSGGGGAGSGFASAFPSGNGGLYGGGGGGGGAGNGGAVNGGNGANGLIVITYIPTSPSVNSTMSSYIIRINGHAYYVVNLFSQNETWVYDQDLEVWTKWADTVGTSVFPVVQTAQFGQSNQPFVVVGQDMTTGKIWTVSGDLKQDDGVNFNISLTTTPLDFGTWKRKFYYRVNLVGDIQSTSQPVQVSYSDTDYQSFSPARTLDMSQLPMPFSVAWGQSRRRIWKFTLTDSNKVRWSAVEFEFEVEE